MGLSLMVQWRRTTVWKIVHTVQARNESAIPTLQCSHYVVDIEVGRALYNAYYRQSGIIRIIALGGYTDGRVACFLSLKKN